MITMTSKRKINYAFGWFGEVPNDNRLPGESTGHLTFMILCFQGDRFYNNHLLKCESEKELNTLFEMYSKRVDLPFKTFPEDFQILAKNTWNDPDYQAEKGNKK